MRDEGLGTLLVNQPFGIYKIIDSYNRYTKAACKHISKTKIKSLTPNLERFLKLNTLGKLIESELCQKPMNNQYVRKLM